MKRQTPEIAAAIALAAAAFAFSPACAQARVYDEIMAEARAAFAADDMTRAADLLDEAQAVRPYSLYLTRNRVLTRILTGRMDEAIALARDIAERGLVLETPPHEAFDRMRAEPAFAPVAARMEANARPVGAAAIVIEYSDDHLLPEALSIDEGRVLIGSVRTGAVMISGDALQPFAKLNGGVFDIEQRKDAVYAAVNNQLAYEDRSEGPFAAIVELNPDTGEEIRRRALAPGGALVGDIEIARSGRIFASDSLAPRIFDLRAGEPAREITDGRFANLQGVALDEKRQRLFIADYLTGLFVLDLSSGEVDAIANPSGAHLGGIDGLYLHRGDLIGVQNGTSPQRIVRIDLDRKGETARSLEVLQQALPSWREPTHGVVAGDDFIYIATSNWPAYDDDGAQKEDARLEPLRLMSVRLSR